MAYRPIARSFTSSHTQKTARVHSLTTPDFTPHFVTVDKRRLIFVLFHQFAAYTRLPFSNTFSISHIALKESTRRGKASELPSLEEISERRTTKTKRYVIQLNPYQPSPFSDRSSHLPNRSRPLSTSSASHRLAYRHFLQSFFLLPQSMSKYNQKPFTAEEKKKAIETYSEKIQYSARYASESALYHSRLYCRVYKRQRHCVD